MSYNSYYIAIIYSIYDFVVMMGSCSLSQISHSIPCSCHNCFQVPAVVGGELSIGTDQHNPSQKHRCAFIWKNCPLLILNFSSAFIRAGRIAWARVAFFPGSIDDLVPVSSGPLLITWWSPLFLRPHFTCTLSSFCVPHPPRCNSQEQANMHIVCAQWQTWHGTC